MAFCTTVEWTEDFPGERIAGTVGAAEGLPDGCLVRIVGTVGTGARVIEVWESEDDAKRFAAQTAPLLASTPMPPPSRVEAFDTAVFLTSTK